MRWVAKLMHPGFWASLMLETCPVACFACPAVCLAHFEVVPQQRAHLFLLDFDTAYLAPSPGSPLLHFYFVVAWWLLPPSILCNCYSVIHKWAQQSISQDPRWATQNEC